MQHTGMKEMYLITFVNSLYYCQYSWIRSSSFEMVLLDRLALPVNCYFSLRPYMKKLPELYCKDGAGTFDIKNVNKTLPL